MAKLSLPVAAQKITAEFISPVVTSYQLAAALFDIVRDGNYRGEELRAKNNTLTKKTYNTVVTVLESRAILKPKGSATKALYFELPLYKTSTAEEIICMLDPFCYLSHLSAMFYYGLTTRIPENLFITTKNSYEWKIASKNKMSHDLGENYTTYSEQRLPKLTKINVEKIKGKTVRCYSTKSFGEFKKLTDKRINISTIGQTFLDMIREPNLCGGIYHVIETYKNHAKLYSKPIIEEINKSGSGIDKVRAGFLLEEVCGIESPSIDQWKGFVQRGGSRKLDPASNYSHEYSEKWSLSINVDGVFDE